MEVRMEVNLDSLSLGKKTAVLLTPAIINGSDTLSLTPMGVYSRNRWIHYERISPDMISGSLGTGKEFSYKAWEKAETPIPYYDSVEWQDWMEGAGLYLTRRELGCCLTELGVITSLMDTYYGPVLFDPPMRYIRPEKQGPKIREIRGEAWIQFPVNETVIYPKRFNNPVELGKIQATIDTVRNDADITINNVSLKGYASPESPYRHNEMLAKNRTEALSRHISKLYCWPDGMVNSAYEPEDWDGLREKVSVSDIAHKDEILELIDNGELNPDTREALIRSRFPKEYRYMLDNWYPVLRRTEYRIEYTVIDFTDPEIVRQKMSEAPGKLSLEEFFLASEGMEDCSQEFIDIWEIAVRVYPESEIANANAAASSIARGELVTAAKFLEKAGDSPQANYSRAVMAVLGGNYAEAEGLFDLAVESGLDCTEALEKLSLVKERGLKTR